MSVKDIIFEEIKKAFGITKLSENMNLYDDLALSSLDALELVGRLEERLNIEINEEALGEVSTLEDFIQVIEKEYEGKKI